MLNASSPDEITISVALTTYNGAKYLPLQLDSISNQMKGPEELVVCDDGSTDDTITILRRFARTAAFPVRIYENARTLGFRANFIRCAELCTSDLVAFCDQDDIWLANKLQLQSADFIDPHVMLSCHNAELVDQRGERLGRRLDQYQKTQILDFNTAGPNRFPRGFTQVVRRSLVKWEHLRRISIDIGNVSEMMSHDAWLFFLALLYGSAAYHHEPLAEHRQHGSNFSGAIPGARARLMGRLSKRAGTYQNLALVWKNRCTLLQSMIAENLDEPERRRADKLLELYAGCASAASSRVRYHASASPGSKLKILLGALARGNFKPKDPWSFPLEAAFKDAAYLLARDSDPQPNEREVS